MRGRRTLETALKKLLDEATPIPASFRNRRRVALDRSLAFVERVGDRRCLLPRGKTAIPQLPVMSAHDPTRPQRMAEAAARSSPELWMAAGHLCLFHCGASDHELGRPWGHHSVSVILVRFGGLSGSKPRSRAACSMVV